MAKTTLQQEWVNQGFQNFVVQETITAPNTTIINRAKVSNSLKSFMGVERIAVRNIKPLKNEFGASGEPVFETDSKDTRIRFVGNWTNSLSIYGEAVILNSADIVSYIEIVFYGTGLNYLHAHNAGTFNGVISVDGGAEGANLFGTGTNVLASRNYRPNQVSPLVSGLSLGWHTVKLRNNSGSQSLFVQGFEIINERSTVGLAAGSAFSANKKENIAALSTLAYNSGISGNRGARVVQYIKNNTHAQVVQEVNASAAYLTSTDHTNEEVVRKINFREFGMQRTDDFSTLTTARAATFTLDDGTTILTANNALVNNERLRFSVANGNFVTITFVGTGLDIATQDDASGTSATDTFDAAVDGTSIGNYTTVGSANYTLRKICSGLPYGTHTVKFSRTNAPSAWNSQIVDFIIYQPKKPAIPEGAVEVADFNVAATYVANATAGLDTIGTGVIRKSCSREILYNGSLILDLQVGQYIGGQSVYTTTAGNTFRYTFFGTGFEYRWRGTTATASAVTISIDGSTNLSGFTSSVYGTGASFTPATGVLNSATGSTTIGAGLSIRGLSLGLHTVVFTATTPGAGGMFIDCLDIITPIHINSSNLKTGSLSLISNDKITPIESSDVKLDLGKAKAWLLYDITNSKVVNAYNISGVYRAGTGDITVFLEKQFKTRDWIAHLSGDNTEFQIVRSSGGAATQTPNAIRLIARNSGGTASDGFVFFTAYGELAEEE